MARMSKTQWLEAEELYKQGWTQKQISERYGVRIESISIHMAKAGVNGGEKLDMVRAELQEALNRKLREFAEKRANRQIDTKEKFHTLINTLLGFYVKELKNAQEKNLSLDKIAGSARALKESITGLKMAREELYEILEIRPDENREDIPDLFVMAMSPEEEERIRNSVRPYDDDDQALMDEIADLDPDAQPDTESMPEEPNGD